MGDALPPLTLAGVSLGRSRHVCAIFDDLDQQVAVMLPFIREGLDAGDKVILVIEAETRDGHLERLRRGGIDVTAAQGRGQLEVPTTDEVYFRGGRFDQEATLALYEEMIQRARSDGFPLTRIIANAPRVLANLPDKHAFLEYEAHLNRRFQDYEDPIICTYDGAVFNGRMVIGVLHTHPVAIMGKDEPVENPFFAPPERFLKTLGQGKGRAQS
jgi:hypothetical protein